MTDPLHQQLLGHLLGALDDDEQQKVDARLEHDAEFHSELINWRRLLAPLEAIRPDFVPPRNLAVRTFTYIAQNAPSESDAAESRRKMSQNPLPPTCPTCLKWIDAAFVTLLLFVCLALIPPAIYASRFQTRLGSCQDGLRQFGLALTEYGYRQACDLETLAVDGRLTPAGVLAAKDLENNYLNSDLKKFCSETWLAVQEVMSGQPIGFVEEEQINTTGTWRLGNTTDRPTFNSPVEMPLLADAPSVHLPAQDGQDEEVSAMAHDGRGRNLLYPNGRVAFLPNSAKISEASGNVMLLKSHSGLSAPIVLVGGR